MQGCEMEFFDNKKVTLFNRLYNADTEEETYYSTLLDCVDLTETSGRNVSKNGIESADTVKLYIDFDNLNKPYVTPKEWKALPEKCKENHITFNTDEDFFVRGDCTNTNLPNENVYEWMRDNFDSVYKIKAVDKYEDILPHFEVGGV